MRRSVGMVRRGFTARTRSPQLARCGRRGLTLIEITIAVAIAGLMAAVVVGAVNHATRASLRSTSVELTGAIKFIYDRAIMERRLYRLGMRIDKKKSAWWIEYTESPYALSRERKEGEVGTVDDAERDLDFDRDDDPEVRAALEGGRAATFQPDESYGEPVKLPDGVKFSKVWTGHQEVPFTSGIAYLHFFSGGWTEPAQIELEQAEEFLTLKVSPLTGKVRTYREKLEDPKPEEASGREEGDE